MYENGDIIESPFGHNVVRVPLSPTQVVWLATDEYRGHFSDEEVESWGKKSTLQEDAKKVEEIREWASTPYYGEIHGTYESARIDGEYSAKEYILGIVGKA